LPVFRQSVPLDKAKKINGLRAVFGEAYPDPVTIVSIGKSVPELLKDPENPEWKNYSIEFCGGTHIATTLDAKHFVVISEGGTAAGIRRIIAWTGEAAQKAILIGNQFGERLNKAKTLKGAELTKELTSLNVDIDALSIPATMKHQFLQEIASLVSNKIGEKKDVAKNAVEVAEQIVVKAKANNSQVIVEEIDVGGDRKALSNALQII